MNSVPIYITVLSSISLYILGHQTNHLREVNGRRAMLATSLYALITFTMFLSLFSFLGLTIYFGFKFGLWAAVKFLGLSFLFELPTALIVNNLHLQKFAWAISLLGIVLIPLIVGIMLYASFH